MAVMEEFIVRVEPRGIIFYDLFTDGNDDDDKEDIIDHKLANQLQLYLRLGNNGKNFWPIELLEKIDIKNLPKNPEKFLARFAIYEHDICSCCKNEFDEWQLDKSLFYVKELFDKQLEEISISDYSEDDDWDSFSGGEWYDEDDFEQEWVSYDGWEDYSDDPLASVDFIDEAWRMDEADWAD